MRRLVILAFCALAACTTLQRSPRSGYASDSPAPADEQSAVGFESRLGRDAREELGFGDRPLSSSEREALEQRVRLKRAELGLASRRDKRLYYKMRSNLRTDAERLYVLSLPTTAARSRYVTEHGLGAGDEQRSDELASVIEAKDIALGMTQKAVSESWGDPDVIENSGDSVYGVERWRYSRYVSGGDGFRKETRLVYFEGGRVAGWERP